jgi:hypothetical protein
MLVKYGPMIGGIILLNFGFPFWLLMTILIVGTLFYMVIVCLKSLIAACKEPYVPYYKDQIKPIPAHGSFTASDLKYMPKS